jgi:hypothetical protein
MRVIPIVIAGLTVSLALSGCSGTSDDELKAQACESYGTWLISGGTDSVAYDDALEGFVELAKRNPDEFETPLKYLEVAKEKYGSGAPDSEQIDAVGGVSQACL